MKPRFIEVVLKSDGDIAYINANHIEVIRPGDECTLIGMCGGEEASVYEVVHSISEVLSYIDDAYST